MKLFDTHCHFDSTDPDAIRAILARAAAAGVEKLNAVGGGRAMNEGARVAASLQTGTPAVVTAFGYDMDGVDVGQDDPPADSVETALADFSQQVDALAPAAIGEIGLDYHYFAPPTRERQMRLFAAQLDAARVRNLPVVVHTREAFDDTLGLLKEIPSKGIIHCFTGRVEEARAFLDLGFFISFSGIVTFKAAENVREAARFVPLDRILIETDAPFLAPVPMRGKVNEPAFIRHTCEALAKERGLSADSFADATFANAERALELGRRSPVSR